MTADHSDCGALDTSAIAIHEFYESLRRAGFNRRQAMQLATALVRASAATR